MKGLTGQDIDPLEDYESPGEGQDEDEAYDLEAIEAELAKSPLVRRVGPEPVQ